MWGFFLFVCVGFCFVSFPSLLSPWETDRQETQKAPIHIHWFTLQTPAQPQLDQWGRPWESGHQPGVAGTGLIIAASQVWHWREAGVISLSWQSNPLECSFPPCSLVLKVRQLDHIILPFPRVCKSHCLATIKTSAISVSGPMAICWPSV